MHLVSVLTIRLAVWLEGAKAACSLAFLGFGVSVKAQMDFLHGAFQGRALNPKP